jgi:hypothetical protein
MANSITCFPFNLTAQNEGAPLAINVIDENGTTEVYSRITPITKPCSIPDSPYIDDTGPAGSKQVEIVAQGPLNISGVDITIGVVNK